jgi:subtilisin family serine protease
VEYAEPNFLGFDDMESVFPVTSGSRWHLDLIRLQTAWQYGKGSPDVLVAIIDSGVDLTHPALRPAILSPQPGDDWDFTAEGGNDPVDEDGHGTFIAGILAGNGTSDVQGICPGCRVLPLRIPLSGQANSYARRADAILYAVNYAAGRRLVINTSWKTTGDVAVVRRAIATAIERGAVVVASAGNDPERRDQPHFPSDYPGVLSVAAVGPDRSRAEYSFYGDRIDVAAPGGTGADKNDPAEDLLSTAPSGQFLIAFGTSFAAPHVAALAALILSQNRALTPAQVAAIIRDTAVSLSADGVGRGLIDAGAAVLRARPAGTTTPTTTTTTTVPTPPATGVPAGLAAINRGDVATLTSAFGLRALTAQLLVAKRPIDDVTRIRNTLGLTAAQYAALAGSSTGMGTA